MKYTQLAALIMFTICLGMSIYHSITKKDIFDMVYYAEMTLVYLAIVFYSTPKQHDQAD